MEHWWNDTDRGNWSTGREKLYTVGGRWMNGYGTLVEWYWQGKPEVLGKKHYIVWVVGEWMGMEHWWKVLTGKNWSTGRETLYSVGGKWMNVYGALVEWYWQGKSEVLWKKRFPGPPCTLQISQWTGLRSNPSLHCGGRRLTMCTVARPRLLHIEWLVTNELEKKW